MIREQRTVSAASATDSVIVLYAAGVECNARAGATIERAEVEMAVLSIMVVVRVNLSGMGCLKERRLADMGLLCTSGWIDEEDNDVDHTSCT